MTEQPPESLLRQTLEELGVYDTSLKIDIIESAAPIEKDNKKVYDKTNEVLSALIDEKPLSESLHVTGEMRALSDPFHRMISRKLWQKHHQKFETVAWLPKQFRYDGTNFLQRMIDNWINEKWQNHLDAMYLLAHRIVDIYAQDEMEPIHYSVFDDEYILLQSKHEHKEHKKNVWLLRSKILNEKLKPKLVNSKNKAELVDPIICRNVIDSLSSPFALNVLYTLEEKGTIPNDTFTDQFGSEPGFKSPTLKNLTVMSFVTSGKEYSITENGKEYLKLFN